jgi:hypothetical protein
MSLTAPKPRTRLPQTIGRQANGWLRTAVPLLLRASWGITFVWFGGLKLAGEPTLPASLIAASHRSWTLTYRFRWWARSRSRSAPDS